MKRLPVALSRLAGSLEAGVRQRVTGEICVDTGDDALDRRIWGMYWHTSIRVSELLGRPKGVEHRRVPRLALKEI